MKAITAIHKNDIFACGVTDTLVHAIVSPTIWL